jgi:ribosomal protein L40E
MIIWGSKAKQKEIATGAFYCPQCREQSPYSHIRVSRYFTLYFIPLFPTDTLGEAICCRNCGGEFKTSVLSLSAEQIEAALQPWVCSKCNNRNPRSESTCVACGSLRLATPPPLPPRPLAPPDDDSRYQPKT